MISKLIISNTWFMIHCNRPWSRLWLLHFVKGPWCVCHIVEIMAVKCFSWKCQVLHIVFWHACFLKLERDVFSTTNDTRDLGTINGFKLHWKCNVPLLWKTRQKLQAALSAFYGTCWAWLKCFSRLLPSHFGILSYGLLICFLISDC